MAENDKEFQRIGTEFARDIADSIFTKSQENLGDMGIDDTGELRLSGTIIETKKDVVVEYDAPHAQPINDGTLPHGVSFEVLKPWIRRKLGIKNEKEVNRIAAAISFKIKRLGTKPQPFFDMAIESTLAEFGIK